MQAIHEEIGLSFKYPENWSVESSSREDDLPQVVISSPHTAFIQLSRHPSDSDMEGMFDVVLAALRAEYGQIEADPCTETLEHWRVQGYSVNFFCHGLISTCWVFGFPSSRGNYLALCQAEDREFERVSDEFRAMLASVMQNLQSQN